MEERINWPEPGKYVLAVSGGVDSMVLLGLLAGAAAARGYELAVAHFDHGIRADAREDAALVRRVAAARGLECAVGEGRLGAGASEAAARAARHEFLGRAAAERGARLVTAHHRDDLLETSLLNLARGTGRRGLAPMQGGGAGGVGGAGRAAVAIRRPLLGVDKAELLDYARARGLEWREDSTNADLFNPRNFLRRELLPRADEQWRSEYLGLVEKMAELNLEIDSRLAELAGLAALADLVVAEPETALSGHRVAIDRRVARDLTLAELSELILYLARRLDPVAEPDRRLLTELALFVKIGRSGKRRPLRAGLHIEINRQNIILKLA